MAGSLAQSPALADSRIATGRNTSDHSRRNGMLCALAVAACVLAADPRANMPFIDDFSYTKTALDFARTGHFIYNGWAVEILGWLIPWGALFIKVFGFSFNVVRFSMLPIDMVTVYLFHQILLRFGVNPQNAVLGTLTMALSPLFMPLAASYMTDIPGLLVILLCMYMCQRAVAAKSDRAALLWLAFAMLLNVAGGTVRQIAWLGSLIMVPSTAWLLRERKGMKLAAVVLFLSSLLGVEACLYWFNHQPYSVPEHIFYGPIHSRMLVHLAAQLLKCFLCLLLVVFPVLAAWLFMARRFSLASLLRLAGAMVGLVAAGVFLQLRGNLDGWLMPWLFYILRLEGMSDPTVWDSTPRILPFAVRCVLSLAVCASAMIFGHAVAGLSKRILQDWHKAPYWRQSFWILGPFSINYAMLLAPRGLYSIIQDRYVLGLVPTTIVLSLLVYQKKSNRFPVLSLVVLTVFAFFAMGATHDLFAESRALVRTIQMLHSAGVPRNSIMAGLASDGWLQVEDGDHINDPRIIVPAGGYNPKIPNLSFNGECLSWITPLTPKIAPQYFIVISPVPCFAKTKYPAVAYSAWLPPFHRALYIEQRLPHTR